jgi:alpha-beta hydrolase superfamily lysophospholipase
MPGSHRLVVGITTGMGLLGTATGAVFMLANYFVEQLSRPHMTISQQLYSWKLPETKEGPPPALRRSLLFHSSDGTLLRGEFLAQPRPAPTVVICHGYRITASYLRPVAYLEYSYGYNVLLFDFRGHGESESVITSGGNAEVRDLLAALSVARQQPETLADNIVIHGFSMGAAVALLTPPQPDVVAIIADSPYARLDAILRNFVTWQLLHDSSSWHPVLHPFRNIFRPLSWATVSASTVVFRLRNGYALIARPDASFKRWQKRALATPQHPPVLLIHGMQDDLVPIAHAYRIAEQAKAHHIPLEMYFAEGSKHCGAYGDNPERYIEVLQSFVLKYLNKGSTSTQRG